MGGLRWQMSDVAVGQLQVKFEGDIVDGVDLKDLLPNLHGEVSLEVIGLLNMHLSQRDMQERARSFQYFLASDG